MKFFIQLHRTIADPSFYREIVALRFRSALWYLFRLTCLLAFVSALAHTIFIVRNGSPLHSDIAEVFSDIRFENGKMVFSKPLPYMPSARNVATILDAINNTNGSSYSLPDSIVVFDTIPMSQNSKRLIQISNKALYLHFGGSGKPAVIQYSQLLDSARTGDFSTTSIRKFFEGVWIFVALGSFLQNASILLGACFSSLFFLFGAVVFSNTLKQIRFKGFMKLVCFALTPVLVGCMLMLVSGTRATLPFSGDSVPWLFYIFVGVSTYSMLRGLRFVFHTPPNKQS